MEWSGTIAAISFQFWEVETFLLIRQLLQKNSDPLVPNYDSTEAHAKNFVKFVLDNNDIINIQTTLIVPTPIVPS